MQHTSKPQVYVSRHKNVRLGMYKYSYSSISTIYVSMVGTNRPLDMINEACKRNRFEAMPSNLSSTFLLIPHI